MKRGIIIGAINHDKGTPAFQLQRLQRIRDRHEEMVAMSHDQDCYRFCYPTRQHKAGLVDTGKQ